VIEKEDLSGRNSDLTGELLVGRALGLARSHLVGDEVAREWGERLAIALAPMGVVRGIGVGEDELRHDRRQAAHDLDRRRYGLEEDRVPSFQERGVGDVDAKLPPERVE